MMNCLELISATFAVCLVEHLNSSHYGNISPFVNDRVSTDCL